MNFYRLFLVLLLPLVFFACSSNPVAPGGEVSFSRDIKPILIQNCALAECHASGSFNPDGLELTSWNSLMVNGQEKGEAIIPYNSFWSSLMAHINSDTNTSLVSEPRMPKYSPGISSGMPLPPNVIDLFARWIDEGAKNDDGSVAFGDVRRKAFITNQASDYVAVVNLDNNFVIRMVRVGAGGATLASPHNVFVDRQGRFFYVTLIRTGYVEKFDAVTYEKLGGRYFCSSPGHVVVTNDGSRGYVTNYDLTGSERFIVCFETQNMNVVETISDVTMNATHGTKLTHDGSRLITVASIGEYIQIINTSDNSVEETIPISENVPPNGNGTGLYAPIALSITPDDNYVLVSCFKSNELCVLDMNTRVIISRIPVGSGPIQTECSPDGRWCYVANRNSNTVSVIDLRTFSAAATIEGVGIQPHGVAFTSDGHFAYITCESRESNNPYLHHPIEQSIRPGTTAVIDVWNGHTKVKDIEMASYPAGISLSEH